MAARRLLVVATLVTSAFGAACDNHPTGVDASESTMQSSVGARKDHVPWHRGCDSIPADPLTGVCR